MTPAVKPAQGSRDVLGQWLRHDLTKQFGRVEPAPAELIALIEALCPADPLQPSPGGDLDSSI